MQPLDSLPRDLQSVGSNLAGNRRVVKRSREMRVKGCRSDGTPFGRNIGRNEGQLRQRRRSALLGWRVLQDRLKNGP